MPIKQLTHNSYLQLAIVASLLMVQNASAEQTIIHAGKLIDVDHSTVLNNQAIVIEDGKIISVQAFNAKEFGKKKIIDWSAYTVSPGFMDMHTHLSGDIQFADTEAYLRAKPEDDVQLERVMPCLLCRLASLRYAMLAATTRLPM